MINALQIGPFERESPNRATQ